MKITQQHSATYLDLESPSDLAKLSEPELYPDSQSRFATSGSRLVTVGEFDEPEETVAVEIGGAFEFKHA